LKAGRLHPAVETLLQLMEKGEGENNQSFHNILLPSQLVVRITK